MSEVPSTGSHKAMDHQSSQPRPLSFLILGCGHFGRRAAQTLLSGYPKPTITVVDKDLDALKAISALPLKIAVDDGISYLSQLSGVGADLDYIIPAIPLHVAFEFMLSRLRPLVAKRTRCPPLAGLPNVQSGASGDVYSSFAHFVCPDDCEEPIDRCTATGRKRPEPLYRILEMLEGPFESRVIRSRQLGPGVGGFRTRDLLTATADVGNCIKIGGLALVSTACSCHGVTSAIVLP
jgi:hypothetical protein